MAKKKTAHSGNLGNRNPVVLIARTRNGGPMRDKRARRSKDAKKNWRNEQWW